MRGAIPQIQNTNVHTPRPMRGAIPKSPNLRFATVSRDRPTESYERVHPAKTKCAFRYSGVPSKTSKRTFRYSGVRKIVWNERMASAVARGIEKSSFAHSFGRPTRTKWRKGYSDHVRKLHFTTILDVRRARSDERVARTHREFAIHHSFARPTITFCVKGCFGNLANLCFTTVLGVRQSLFALRVAAATWKFAFHHSFGRPTITFCVKGCLATWKICVSPQFWASDVHELTRGLSPAATYQTYPAEKKRRNFTEEQHFQRAAVSAVCLSSLSQQLFSAALLSIFSQQPFSAAFLSSSSQPLFSAAFLSSSYQQLFQQLFCIKSFILYIIRYSHHQ